MRSLTGCTPWVANPPDPVKDKRLCRACGILDRASRACCWKNKSGLRRTVFIHADVQLALAIFAKILSVFSKKAFLALGLLY